MAFISKTNSSKVDVSDTIFRGVISMLKRRSKYEGTMSQLNGILVKSVGRNDSKWPGSPSALRVSLNRVVNRLRNAGVSIRFVRSTDHVRTRLVKMTMQ